MELCFFGAYDPFYPRIAILRRGLKLNSKTVFEWRLPLGLKSWARYPLCLLRVVCSPACLGKRRGALFVPSFGHKDVPLAFLLTRLLARPLIFDPLASRYETKITDWRRKREESWTAWWNRVLDRLAMRMADLTLADTKTHQDYYIQEFGLRREKTAVLPVGFDDSLWHLENMVRPKSEKFTVVFFGSFLPLHGAEQIVQAAFLLSAEKPNLRFLLIGSGQTWPRIRSLLEGARPENLLLWGWLPETRLAHIVAKEADLCLGLFGATPKARRVVPHKVFQAMALGKPVLTLDTPAVREFFRHQEEIYLCPSAEPEAIAESILALQQQEELRQKIARQGKALVWEKYSPASLGRVLIELIEKRFN